MRDIYLSLMNVSRIFSLDNIIRTRIMGYKNPMNPSMKAGSKSLFFTVCLFSESLPNISLSFL